MSERAELDSGYTAVVDRTVERQWSESLLQFADANIYQSWAYGAVRWGEKNLSHFVLKKNEETVAMAQLRIVRFPFIPGGMAYLRWGPLCCPGGNLPRRETLVQIMSALAEEYVERRGLWLRVLSHVPAGDEVEEYWRESFASIGMEYVSRVAPYRTFLLDLTPSVEELRKGLHQKWRNQLNRSCKNDLHVTEGTSDALYRRFLAIYNEMFERKRFETTVDVDEFGRIQAALPEPLKMRILLCEYEGRTVSALVGSAMGDTGIYLLGATSNDGMALKGSYLLQWRMIQLLKEQGCKRYDLGGINPEKNPGVHHFKKGMSGVDVSHLGQYDVCRNPLSALCVRLGERLKR